MNHSPDHEQNEKAVRLVEYLLRLVSLRTKLVRDISDYAKTLWISAIPRQKGCFTQAWGRDEDYDSDVWIEIQNQREPELPSIPPSCKDWIDNKTSLRNKNDLPELLLETTRQVENPAWREGSDQLKFISHVEHLKDHPKVQKAWDRYVEEHWLRWTEEHNAWENVHKVYSALFAIHQEQLRLGEEYELVLGLGLLTWQTPNSQRVHRHLIVANALLEFEARLGRFTVRPMPDGADVRPELDMLAIEEQPAHAEETAKSSLASAGGDPWEKGCIEGVLQALVHSINPEGQYEDTLEAKIVRTTTEPRVEYAPALILRKRSAKGLTEALKRIQKRIEEGEDIPGEFGDLAEIPPKENTDSENGPGEANNGFEGEVFFPKPSNEEQRRIIDKIREASGVLVQGPPGTGKSHTIANLICHLLATGQRTLITAKTPRALQVLERLVPDELRPLCINLLGSGLEEKQSLESSVNGILNKNQGWNEKLTTRKRKQLEQKLCELREEKAKIVRRLRDIRESETHAQTIAEGAYRGTAARIAEAVNRDRGNYEWFTDAVPLDKPCPISENDLRNLLAALRSFTPEKRQELNLTWPDVLPSAEEFTNLVESEKKAIEEERELAKGADAQHADDLSKIDVATIVMIRDSISAFQDKCRRLSSISAHPWMHDALGDVIGGNPALWDELSRLTRDEIDPIIILAATADNTSLDMPDDANARMLLDDACKLKEHMQNGGKLGWGPFRPKLVKECIHLLKTVRINGRFCTSLEHMSVLADALCVRVGCEKAWGLWAGRCENIQGPYALQLRELKALCEALDDVLSLEVLIEQCRSTLKQCLYLGEPSWANVSEIELFISSCRLALANHAKCLAVKKISDIEAPIISFAARSNAHKTTSELLQAIRDRDIDGIACACNKIQKLEKMRKLVQKVDEYIKKLRHILPKIMIELEYTCHDTHWETRILKIQSAWRWAQARFWVEKYIKKEDVPSLAKRARQIEDEINATIATLASLHAWSFCFSRLSEDHQRHMAAWQQSINRLGRGTGRHAPRHRREARQHLNQCREAVPAWVMPLHRVWDTVDPAPGIFDVIIVDEASQCGIEALPLFYLGKKILIVGDDKQISPEAVGLPRDAVHRLMEEFLYDFKFRSSFHVESSLFDHGKLRYGTRKITLREHFRCMPEIIEFSNNLFYSDTPLIPLRQYGPERLTPLEHVFVREGYREGKDNRAVNRPEANALVEKVVELCAHHKYSNKTIGVIVLQGEAQASLIEGQLLERLGAVEMEKRRLICGNPYSFQGDERDIILLSMVAAPNERIGPLTGGAAERRINVAASRARDQMYLFHSVTSSDLSTSCLRRRFLEFFEGTKPQKIAGITRDDLEKKAAQDNRAIIRPPQPFDSWFEVDVALELLRKKFIVVPQHEVAGKRIDLVVEGGQARLAVECDGDEWHGADRYEEDMLRQRQLERCGWEFFRVRESAFYSNKENALQGLWRALEERNIFSDEIRSSSEMNEDSEDFDEVNPEEPDENAEDHNNPSTHNDSEDARTPSNRRPEEVSASEIQDALIQALSTCPNQSCTIHSLAARVLKEVGVRTRSNPRLEFEKRVMRCLDVLEKREIVEKYKAKNKRVKLLKFQHPLLK